MLHCVMIRPRQLRINEILNLNMPSTTQSAPADSKDIDAKEQPAKTNLVSTQADTKDTDVEDNLAEQQLQQFYPEIYEKQRGYRKLQTEYPKMPAPKTWRSVWLSVIPSHNAPPHQELAHSIRTKQRVIGNSRFKPEHFISYPIYCGLGPAGVARKLGAKDLDAYFLKLARKELNLKPPCPTEAESLSSQELENGATRFGYVCATGNLEYAQVIYAKGIYKDIERSLALACAAMNGHLNVVEWWLEKAKLPVVSDSTWTQHPLYAAAEYGQTEVLAYLLKRFPQEEIETLTYHLQHAASNGHLAAVRILREAIKARASLDEYKKCLKDTFIDDVNSEDDGQILEALSTQPEFSLELEDQYRCLVVAVIFSNLEIIGYLVSKFKLDPNQVADRLYSKPYDMPIFRSVSIAELIKNYEYKGIEYLVTLGADAKKLRETLRTLGAEKADAKSSLNETKSSPATSESDTASLSLTASEVTPWQEEITKREDAFYAYRAKLQQLAAKYARPSVGIEDQRNYAEKSFFRCLTASRWSNSDLQTIVVDELTLMLQETAFIRDITPTILRDVIDLIASSNRNLDEYLSQIGRMVFRVVPDMLRTVNDSNTSLEDLLKSLLAQYSQSDQEAEIIFRQHLEPLAAISDEQSRIMQANICMYKLLSALVDKNFTQRLILDIRRILAYIDDEYLREKAEKRLGRKLIDLVVAKPERANQNVADSKENNAAKQKVDVVAPLPGDELRSTLALPPIDTQTENLRKLLQYLQQSTNPHEQLLYTRLDNMMTYDRRAKSENIIFYDLDAIVRHYFRQMLLWCYIDNKEFYTQISPDAAKLFADVIASFSDKIHFSPYIMAQLQTHMSASVLVVPEVKPEKMLANSATGRVMDAGDDKASIATTTAPDRVTVSALTSQQAQATTWTILNADLLALMARYLKLNELIISYRVCKNWYVNLALKHDELWKFLAHNMVVPVAATLEAPKTSAEIKSTEANPAAVKSVDTLDSSENARDHDAGTQYNEEANDAKPTNPKQSTKTSSETILDAFRNRRQYHREHYDGVKAAMQDIQLLEAFSKAEFREHLGSNEMGIFDWLTNTCQIPQNTAMSMLAGIRFADGEGLDIFSIINQADTMPHFDYCGPSVTAVNFYSGWKQTSVATFIAASANTFLPVKSSTTTGLSLTSTPQDTRCEHSSAAGVIFHPR